MAKTTKEVVGIIGSGTMGSGIAWVAAAAGNMVRLYDSNESAIKRASGERKKMLDRQVDKGALTADRAKEMESLIREAHSLSDLSECTLVIEAIVENAEIKRKVFSDLEAVVNQDCILATNTSSLSITSIASACRRQSRVIGLHFFNPAPLMPLVEVIPGIATSDETLRLSKKTIDAWGKTTVIAKDTPGFIVNRIARPFYGEAIRIYEERWKGLPDGQTGMATIDWAMKELGGFKMGPFELMDMIGIDVNYAVTETVWQQTFFDQRYKPSITQKRLFESGRWGRKTKVGFYSYESGATMPEPQKNVELGAQIVARITSMLINEAADALYYNIATRDDIDLAMVKGVGYPQGLLKWCDETGADKIFEMITELRRRYAEDRYRPSLLLQNMIKSGAKFYS